MTIRLPDHFGHARATKSALIAAGQGRHRKPGGKRLETLLLKSPHVGVELVRHPNGVQWLPGGRTVPKRGPVDFSGVFTGTGRAIYFDTKECEGVNVLTTSTSTLPEHQRLELIRLGHAGALAGLLCLRTRTDELYWADWRLLIDDRPSIRWDVMHKIGLAGVGIQWWTLNGVFSSTRS